MAKICLVEAMASDLFGGASVLAKGPVVSAHHPVNLGTDPFLHRNRILIDPQKDILLRKVGAAPDLKIPSVIGLV